MGKLITSASVVGVSLITGADPLAALCLWPGILCDMRSA